MPHWLTSFTIGTHGCFFYRDETEYLELGSQYLKSSLTMTCERCLWIVPPHLNVGHAVLQLQNRLGLDLKPFQKEGKLMILPWERWFGDGPGFDVTDLFKKGKRLIEDSLKEGYRRLKIFTHALPHPSPHWDRFLQLEERMDKRLHTKPVVSLCAYRLTDCPAVIISQIIDCHEISLVRHGEGWEFISRSKLLAASA